MRGLALGSIGSIGSRLQRLSMQKAKKNHLVKYSGNILVKHARISFLNFCNLAAVGDWRPVGKTLTSIPCYPVDAIPSYSCVEGSGLVISF